ncbi:hypothetical protein [Deinococcus sedimenti]|uniref:Cation:proton antiporter n=1 Tax=Deinococcus sedimenti TaxID=1867090 RepID=A0ABQ2S7L2_9DEIO|nr:hypothetical protein [Deinococcus sedimenti]GGS05043.1 hypothetical protein GCM10008960_34470 [Deinococcus sedimenti]
MTDTLPIALFGLVAFLAVLLALGTKLPLTALLNFRSSSGHEMAVAAAFITFLTFLLKL